MAKTPPRLLLSVSLIALVTALAAPKTHAQETEETTVLNPITVTGEKVARSLAQTASTVSVTSAEQIEGQRVGRATVDEIVAATPNVIYPDNVSAPVIRGIDTQGAQNGSVAFFGGTVPRGTVSVDGHNQSFYELYFSPTSTWDIDTIEVFSGPQTTSQGANAIAGAIIVNTKDPTFTPEGAYRLEYGSDNTRRLSFAYSNALSNDLAARIAVDYYGRDGLIDYTNPSFTAGDADADFENLSLRGKLLWTPTDIDGLAVKLTYAFSDGNRPTQEMATTPYGDLENSYATSMPSWDTEAHTATLDVDYDFFNGIKLYNQFQLNKNDMLRTTGASAGDAIIAAHEVSNETRLTFGDTGDALSGLVGIYARRVESNDTLWLYSAKSAGGAADTVYDDTKTYVGLFGEATWRFAERWSLNGGLRLEHDRIERSGRSRLISEAADYDQSFTEVLPRLSLTYEITPDWTVGALYSRGYNPGGLSPNFTTYTWEEFAPETIDNFEIFTRASLLEDRLFVTANLFYMDYKDAQYNVLNEVSPGVFNTYTINAEKSHAYGLDLGLEYAVRDNLRLRGSLGLLDTEIEEISRNTSFEGNEFAKAAPVTLTLGADWGVSDRLRIGGQMRYVGGGYYSDVGNTAAYKVGDYAITDIQASYQIRPTVELYGYVNNILDVREATFMQFNRTGGGVEASVTTPRTVGLGLRGTF